MCVVVSQTSWHFVCCCFFPGYLFIFESWVSSSEWMDPQFIFWVTRHRLLLSSVLYRLHIGSLACFALWRTSSQPFARYQGFRYHSSAYTSDSSCSLNPRVVYTHISMRVIKCKLTIGSLVPRWVIHLICKHETLLDHISFRNSSLLLFLNCRPKFSLKFGTRVLEMSPRTCKSSYSRHNCWSCHYINKAHLGLLLCSFLGAKAAF